MWIPRRPVTSNHYIYVHPFLQPSLLFTLTVSRVSHAKSILDLKAAFSLIQVQTPNPVPKVSIILLRSHSKTRMCSRNRYINNRTHIYQTSFLFCEFSNFISVGKAEAKVTLPPLHEELQSGSTEVRSQFQFPVTLAHWTGGWGWTTVSQNSLRSARNRRKTLSRSAQS